MLTGLLTERQRAKPVPGRWQSFKTALQLDNDKIASRLDDYVTMWVA